MEVLNFTVSRLSLSLVFSGLGPGFRGGGDTVRVSGSLSKTPWDFVMAGELSGNEASMLVRKDGWGMLC